MGGAAIKLKRELRISQPTQDQKFATQISQKHYHDLKARFDRLNPSDKRFYIDYLDAMYSDLGTTFGTSEREEFEDTLTDIHDFGPFMEAMVAWKLVEIEYKENQQEQAKQIEESKEMALQPQNYQPQDTGLQGYNS